MTKQLIIRFIDSAIEAGTVLPWFLFDQQQQLIDDGHHALNEIYSQLSQENQDSLEVHIIVPNDAVLLAQVNIPSQNARQIKQALPYAIEELIAEDIENVHMALPNYLNVTNHMTDVAVVSHRYLISWLDLLHHHGLSPDSMAIDTLCVPIEEGGSVLVDDDERLLVRYSQTYGFSCDTAVFPYLYPQGLTESANEDELPLLEVLHCSCDETAQNFEYPGAIESHYKESGSEILAVTLANPQNKTINLLQGGYKQVDSSISVTQVWFKPLAAAAVCLFLFVVGHLSVAMYFNYQADQLLQQSVSYYKSLFPEEQRVVSPKRQLKNHLRLMSSGEGGGFLSTLSTISAEFKDYTNVEKISVNQMSYSKDANSLKLELTSETIEQLDELKQRLAAAGISAMISSARVQNDGVISNMTVEAQ